MRSSLSFSLDSTEDAKLIEWLSSQPNRSATIRDALHVAMQGAPEVATAPLLAATRRIEAELNELKKLVLDAAGGFSPVTHVSREYPGNNNTLSDFLNHELGNNDVPGDTDVPNDVLANLRKLK